MVSNFDFALEPGQALNKYMTHRKILIWLLCIDAIYEIGLIIYIFSNKDFVLAQLGEIYRNIDMKSMTQIFMVSYTIDLSIGIISFMMGYYAIYSHKTKYYHWFNNLLLLSVFWKIIISYLNV